MSQSTDNQTCFGSGPQKPDIAAGNEKSGRCAFGMSQLELLKAAAPVPQPLSPWLVNEAQSLSVTIAQPALSRPVRKASHGKAQ